MAGVGGAAVPGRLSLAGTEARPTELFSYGGIRLTPPAPTCSMWVNGRWRLPQNHPGI